MTSTMASSTSVPASTLLQATKTIMRMLMRAPFVEGVFEELVTTLAIAMQVRSLHCL